MPERVMFEGGCADGTEGIVVEGEIQPVVLVANGGVDHITDDDEVIFSYDRYTRTDETRDGFRVYRHDPPEGDTSA
jgi:hypothetical protein